MRQIPQMTDMLDLSGMSDKVAVQGALTRLLGNSKMVCLGGPSASGKSFTAAHYSPKGIHLSKWDRSAIYKMFRDDGHLDNRFHGELNRLEDAVIPELMLDEGGKVLVEGYFRYPRLRRRALKWAGAYESTILIFDGPDNQLVDRGEQMYNKSREELEWDLQIYRETFDPPTFKEGWKNIFYVTTCGDEGVEYLINQYGE